MKLTYSHLVILIACLVSILTRKINPERSLRSFSWYLIVTVVVEIIALVMIYSGQHNTLVYNLFFVYTCYRILSFYSILISEPVSRKIVWLLSLVIPAVCLLNFFFFQGPNVYNTYTRVMGSIVLVFVGMRYIYHLYSGVLDQPLQRIPEFWITLGIIFFYVCSLSFLGSVNFIITLPRKNIEQVSRLFIFVNVLTYALFTTAYLCRIPRSGLNQASAHDIQ